MNSLYEYVRLGDKNSSVKLRAWIERFQFDENYQLKVTQHVTYDSSPSSTETSVRMATGIGAGGPDYLFVVVDTKRMNFVCCACHLECVQLWTDKCRMYKSSVTCRYAYQIIGLPYTVYIRWNKESSKSSYRLFSQNEQPRRYFFQRDSWSEEV